MAGGKPCPADSRLLRWRAVLFDLDGVLVDPMALVHRAWRWWAESRGLDPLAVARASRGGPAVETVRRAAPQMDAEREAARISDYEADAAHEVRAFPGALSLLTAMARGGGSRSRGIVTAARAAGMHVIAIASTRTPSELGDAQVIVPALTSLSISAAEVGFIVRTAPTANV